MYMLLYECVKERKLVIPVVDQSFFLLRSSKLAVLFFPLQYDMVRKMYVQIPISCQSEMKVFATLPIWVVWVCSSFHKSCLTYD